MAAANQPLLARALARTSEESRQGDAAALLRFRALRRSWRTEQGEEGRRDGMRSRESRAAGGGGEGVSRAALLSCGDWMLRAMDSGSREMTGPGPAGGAPA